MTMALTALMTVSPVLAAAPSEWYFMDEDGTVRRETPEGSVKVLSARPRDVAGPYGGAASRPLRWFPVDSTISDEMKGSTPGIWVFDLNNLEHAPLFIPMELPTRCYEVCVDPQAAFLVVCAFPTLTVYSFDGERQGEAPGFGPLFWIDDFRFLYTSCVPGTKRGRREDADPWKGAAVMQVLHGEGPFDVSVESVMEPTATADYNAMGLEDGQCVLVEHSVPDAGEWDKPEPKIQFNEMRAPLPAAG